ncbi:hypothetical protein ACR03S_03865 [Limimaricola variabilis]
MKHTIEFQQEDACPNWYGVTEARSMLREQIDAFVANIARSDREQLTPERALALKVTAGLGKTDTTLRAIAQHAEPLLKRGHVLFYTPTLALAERAAEAFRIIAPDVPGAVIRGRSALLPGQQTEFMCSRSDLVAKISGLVPSITEALCRAKKDDGTFVEAPCAAGCAYLAQKAQKGPRVIFLSHAYLTSRPPIDADTPVALRIVDEKCWQSLSKTSEIYLEDFMCAPPSNFSTGLRAMLAATKSVIIEALQSNKRLHDMLRAEGISQQSLIDLVCAEAEARVKIEVRPWEATATVHARVDLFDRQKYFSSAMRQKIFSTLAEKEGGSCNRISFWEGRGCGETRQMIRIHSFVPLDRDAPLLLLDADADPEITQRLAPGAEFVRIDVKPTADIVQISDRTFSNTWLLDPAVGAERRGRVLTQIDREVEAANGMGVLVVATKKVLEALHADAGQPVGVDVDKDLVRPLCGATPRWFGPSMQGVNDFETFHTILIVGRLQPHVADIESAARCLFGDDEAEIVEHKNGPLPEQDTRRLLADGRMPIAKIRVHPDARASIVLRQLREATTLQAIARLRLVAPRQPKRVIILSSLPLTDFPVSHLGLLASVYRGIEAEPDPIGFLRLEAAFKATMGQTVIGSRLSNSGLVADLPLDFETIGAARHFRRGRTTADLLALVRRIATINGWPVTMFYLQRPTQGGKIVPAVVFCDKSTAISAARKLWPHLVPRISGLAPF